MRTLFVIALLIAAPAFAQDRTAEVDKVFSWVKPGTPGCVVAASVKGTLVVNRAYGLADLERNVPLTTHSRFDAASIRKQFVAAAVLMLAEEKRLALTDDVRKYVPEMPDYGRTITLDHMLTHTSGLRDWISLRNYNSGSDPALPMILRQRHLEFEPGEEWSYSNSGYVLLTEVVARVTKMTFAEFARTRLFEPLGMKATTYVNDLRQVIPNRALAYEPEGSGWRMDMLIENERGGGGALFSTARDLVTWNDALASGRLGTFVTQKLHEPAVLDNGRKVGYGRGIFLNTNYAGPFFMHGGGAAAYRSILARFPGRSVAVAVLCNAGEASDDRDAFAARVFDLYGNPDGVRPPATPIPATENSAPIEGLDVASKAGLFFSEQVARPLRLGANNGRLVVAGVGPLIAITRDRFRIARPTLEFMSGDAFEVQFLSADEVVYKSMEGQTLRFLRGRPGTLTAADLKAYAGRYESPEMRAFFDVTPSKTGLMIRLNDPPGAGMEFSAVDRDTFQRGQITFRFRRNATGALVSVDMNTPGVRRVTFTRSQ